MNNKIKTNELLPIPPGGPANGSFWGVMAQSGLVIAPQMAMEEYAKFLVQAGNAAQCNFETIQKASIRLREIMERDLDNGEGGSKFLSVSKGAENYLIRAVMESVFGEVEF